MVVRVAIAGIGGRMGRELAAAAVADPELVLVGGVARPGSPLVGRLVAEVTGAPAPEARIVGDPAALLTAADVLVDFTTAEATVAHARACAAAGRPIVAGTTGLSAAQLTDLRAVAERVPVFYARNTSVGIAALLDLLPGLVRALDGYDVEIVEAHHRHKVDAPSGTALALAEAIAGARGAPLDETAVYGRRGVAPRRAGEIGIHAVRGGGNAGEHTIVFADDGEEVRLTHRAFSRRTFALGALRAAKFVVGRPPGLYAMGDLLAAGG